jgi:hypothetical protein
MISILPANNIKEKAKKAETFPFKLLTLKKQKMPLIKL